MTVEADGVARYPQDVESAVYFSCLEALNNIAKYADASPVSISLAQRNGSLEFGSPTTGVGSTLPRPGTGPVCKGMADRLDAIGGALRVESNVGIRHDAERLDPDGAELRERGPYDPLAVGVWGVLLCFLAARPSSRSSTTRSTDSSRSPFP